MSVSSIKSSVELPSVLVSASVSSVLCVLSSCNIFIRFTNISSVPT